MLRIEIVLLGVAILIAWIYPTAGSRWFDAAERKFSTVAHRRELAIVLVGATALALRLAVLPVEPIPEPIVHDEFGYLLAADTFAHGRLTNPTPPLWEHFETFHVILHPTYQTIYPPAQGVFLAVGQVLLGHPFWGVWLSIGLMCAAITWMLQGWFSPEWALLGGILATLRYGVFGYWADSYWGGAVAAIGGALALGALPRTKKSLRVRDAVIMGIGLGIMANSRPYEGFVLSIPIAVLLLRWIFKKDSPTLRTIARQVLLPLMSVVVILGAATGYYYWRVTGSPFRMAYQVERHTYAIAPYMIWQRVKAEPAYHHPVMRKMFVEEEMEGLRACHSLTGIVLRGFQAGIFFLGVVLTFPFLILVVTIPVDMAPHEIDGGTRALLFILSCFIIGTLLVNFYSPHYSAPATALILAFVIIAMRALRAWGQHGLFLARAVPCVCVLCLGIRAAAKPLNIPLQKYYEYAWYQQKRPAFGREIIENELLRTPGRHLVIVDYNSEHQPFEEWVYNAADLDNARIIWARDMGPERNAELTRYFNTRRAWVLQADVSPLHLSPFLGSSTRTSSKAISSNQPMKVEAP